MPNQAGLTFDPQHEGLFRAVVTNGQIDHARWLRAHAEGGLVGTCRSCGNHLKPRQPDVVNGVTWYEAECINTSCGKTVAAPGGRALARSSRHGEMPGGWWERRNHALKTSSGEDT